MTPELAGEIDHLTHALLDLAMPVLTAWALILLRGVLRRMGLSISSGLTIQGPPAGSKDQPVSDTGTAEKTATDPLSGLAHPPP